MVEDGRPVELARGRQRALLAVLLLHANEVVSSDRLIDGLWGERPPATASKVLQNAVSQLRRALGDGLIVTRAPGYLLRVEPDAIDARRFESLVADGKEALGVGRAEEAARILRDALALWRGPPLDEFAYEPFADAEAARLQELRLRTLEERIEADLALGRHADLVGELERLVTEHPLRERPRGQLMLALYQSGRQAEALRAYQEGRRVLSEELGLDPGGDLQQLEQQILVRDPALEPPRPPKEERPGEPKPRARRGRRLAVGVVVLAFAVAAVVAVFLAAGGDESPAVVPNSVVKIDPESGRIVGVFDVAGKPSRPAVVGDYVFSSSTDEGLISRIDLRTGNIDAFGGMASPAEIAAGAENTFWVGSFRGDDEVRRFDVDDFELRRVIHFPNGTAPWAIAVGAGSVWVSSSAPGAVSRFDERTGSVQARYRHAPSEENIVFSNEIAFADGATWTAKAATDSGVLRIDADGGGTNSITVGQLPYAVAVAYGSVWLTDLVDEPAPTSRAGRVFRLDAVDGKLQEVIPVGKRPSGVAAGGGSVWVANGGETNILEIDPRTSDVVRKIDTRYYPESLAYGRGFLWVALRAKPFTF
ncbi:MAG: BTAD domain-containing putative transcriptional regulator [Gaiellaceae bacterium]